MAWKCSSAINANSSHRVLTARFLGLSDLEAIEEEDGSIFERREVYRGVQL